ncbi:MAG: hypothetical protein EA357_01455 [Micavibrio sp.]|nr:MAG: hypothetical protein EA357_01455 [Micavibrio sp.]
MGESKLADFIESKKGGALTYGTFFGTPIALVFAIASGSPVAEFDKTTNPQSQDAVAEYRAENRELMSVYNSLSVLREAAANQSSPDAVLEFMNHKAEVKAQLEAQARDFKTRILTDDRLTEGDYAAMRQNLDLQNTDYLNLPNGSRFLDESRAAATSATAEGQAVEIRDAMLSNANAVEEKGNAAFFTLLFGLMLATALAGGGIGEDLRRGAKNALRRRAEKSRKPKH